jgi:carboxylate-amine ligase
MPDASHLWWAVRPSAKYPTLELRAPDCCTRLDDTIAIAALYRVLARFLYRNPDHNADIDVIDRAIAVENKWRAQRYGVQGTFATRSGAVPVGGLLDRVLELTAAETDAFACREQLDQCRAIVLEGTSADAQLRVFSENQRDGQAIALHKVTRWISDATLLA